VNNIRSTLAAVWRIAAPYFYSEDKWAGRGLLAAVIAIELAVVFLTVLFNRWNNVFYNALQERNQAVFTYQIGYFCVLAAFWIGLKVYQLYLNQWLQIRWRRWMTDRYLGGWLHDANHYRMQLLGDAADNPDQRIAEDTQRFVEQTLQLGIGLLSAVVTLVSFVFILWGLSNEAPLHLFGKDIAIPSYLVWGALIYAVLGTTLTHLIGWPLITLNLDLKSEEPEHLSAIWQSLESHRTWLTSAPRTADGSEAPLTVRPILVLTGSSNAQQKVFYDDRPVGSDLLVFGSVHTFEQNPQATPSVLEPEAATDYRRWWNNPWDVVEAGGQTKAGLWTPADASRLKALVEHAHNHGLWIRFYTLDGVGSGSAEKDLEPTSEASKTLSSFGWFRGYNFGSPAAVEQRWRAAAGAGVDFIASDQYEQLAALLRTLSQRVQP